jgi:hypothetical protein
VTKARLTDVAVPRLKELQAIIRTHFRAGTRKVA